MSQLKKAAMSHLKTASAVSAVCLGLMVSATTFSASQVTDAIKERIKPAGSVCMAGDDCAGAVVAAAPAASGPRSGQEVYDSKCVSCHGTGAAGAPKLGDKAAWGPRIGKGIDVLYTSALQGFNGMPAKGLCMDCSDEEIKATVDLMVASGQ